MPNINLVHLLNSNSIYMRVPYTHINRVGIVYAFHNHFVDLYKVENFPILNLYRSVASKYIKTFFFLSIIILYETFFVLVVLKNIKDVTKV